MDQDITLEKMDIIRERLGVSYTEAKNALDKTNGDVIEALVMLEQEHDPLYRENPNKKVIDRVKALIKKGNATKLRIKKDGKTVAEVPSTLGAVGILGSFAYTPLAFVGAIGTLSAIFNRYTLEIEKPNGEVEEHDLMTMAEEDGEEKKNVDS